MDTDTLLQPVKGAANQTVALMELVKANTEAFKEIRVDLSQCNNVDKVMAIIAKVEAAMQDLSMDSQKVPPQVKDVPDIATVPRPYGQYPILDPLNPDNPVPVPLPPDYASDGSAEQTHTSQMAKGGKK